MLSCIDTVSRRVVNYFNFAHHALPENNTHILVEKNSQQVRRSHFCSRSHSLADLNDDSSSLALVATLYSCCIRCSGMRGNQPVDHSHEGKDVLAIGGKGHRSLLVLLGVTSAQTSIRNYVK